MVGVPGKYKGCETCRRRRVKCDNMRPICRKCVSTGRSCEGYERQMIFITATPEDGGREPLRPAWDDLLFLSDKHSYYTTQIVSLQTKLAHVSRGVSSSIFSPPSYELPDFRPASSSGEFSVSGQCIVNIDSASEPKSGLCVFLYEPNNCSSSPPETSQWKGPHDYMNTVQAAGPQAFTLFPAHHFFSRTAWSLLTRKATHLAQRDWATTPWQYYPKSLIDRLFDILVQIPDLLERADATSHHVPTQDRQLKIQDLLTRCLYIDRQLNEWCAIAAQDPEDSHRHSYWISRSPQTQASMPFSETFAFINAATAVGFLYYWMGSLLLNRSILNLHRLFSQPAVDYNMYPPVLPVELNIDVSNYQRDGIFAANICCSLDFALNTSTQPDVLAGPLAVADMYFKGFQGGGQSQLETACPDGHVFQVEYASEAVKRGTCAVGVKGKDVVVLGCEKRSAMKLQDTRITPSKLGLLDNHVCLAFAGLNADARILVDKARIEAQSHRLTVEDPVTIEYITKYVAGVQQRYTQSGGVRPFGISTLIVGFDKGSEVPRLYQTEPSGIYSAWKANAIGRSSKTVREFLERNYKDDMDRDATVRLAIKSLLEVVQTGAKNIEIALMAPGKSIEMMPLEEIEAFVKSIEEEKQEEAAKKKTGRTPGTGTATILTRGPDDAE
ncbi:Proteasome subunit alpha type-4 [Ceratocystis platani]|uniref:Proteasome subunit alpha type-4 n=1 Tax=Ceratocystis fimbriata f. sp. platani TaxID=88771 RepID=A0A0F8B3M5_CERFI|nr:Proteasome subunit alpha type-4 [Ceratocystis platani]